MRAHRTIIPGPPSALERGASPWPRFRLTRPAGCTLLGRATPPRTHGGQPTRDTKRQKGHPHVSGRQSRAFRTQSAGDWGARDGAGGKRQRSRGGVPRHRGGLSVPPVLNIVRTYPAQRSSTPDGLRPRSVEMGCPAFRPSLRPRPGGRGDGGDLPPWRGIVGPQARDLASAGRAGTRKGLATQRGIPPRPSHETHEPKYHATARPGAGDMSMRLIVRPHTQRADDIRAARGGGRAVCTLALRSHGLSHRRLRRTPFALWLVCRPAPSHPRGHPPGGRAPRK